MTVNGVHVALLFLSVLGVCLGLALRGSWRDEVARIREANKPAEPFIDYERLHYGPALKAFLDKQGDLK